MNDPRLASKRLRVVKDVKSQGIPKEEAWSAIQHQLAYDFEGHAVEKTIDRVYGRMEDETS